MSKIEYRIRKMNIEDYDEVYQLWQEIKGFAIRSIDDSKEGIGRFIQRNPSTSMVAVKDDKIIGAILCGHDGRSACFYHVCVKESYRMHGIGQTMVYKCLDALKEEKICKVNLMAFKDNQIGNQFWKGMEWKIREDINYYEAIILKQDIEKIKE